MWKYIRQYLYYLIPAGIFMVGEVSMDLVQPSLMSRIVDEGVLGLSGGGSGSLSLILQLGVRMILLTLLGGTFGVLNNIFVNLGGQNIGNQMRKDCFARVMRFSFSQTDRFSSGSLVTRVTNDITLVQNLVSMFVRGMVRTGMLMFGSMFCMVHLNRTFGLIVLCACPVIVFTVLFCMVKAQPIFLRLQKQLDQINTLLQEDLTGIRTIKACVHEAYEKIRFGKKNESLTATQLAVLTLFAFMNPTANALMYLVVALILLSGCRQVPAGTATPGSIMAAVTYTTQLLNGILMLVMLFQDISRGLASWKRVREVLETEPDMKAERIEHSDGVSTAAPAEQAGADADTDADNAGNADAGDAAKIPQAGPTASSAARCQIPPAGAVELCDVSFRYPGTETPVFSHVNLKVRPGETVAIMGATGCGKSTLVSLIPRFYEAAEGAVLVDGSDVRSYEPEKLREKIAFVLQKSELFTGTIRENIAWGRPDASEEEIREAARIAQAADFIAAQPQGWETMVAEKGASLSGGQKQRLSIARALLKDAEILVLDDASSALDLKTEADFYAALGKARPSVTKIVVAQRIATARRADRIAVMDGGTIAAVGSHEQLMRTCRVYQDICRSQLEEDVQ